MSDTNPPAPPEPNQTPPPASQAPTPTPQGPTSEEKNMGMLAHLLVFSGYLVPFGNIIGPLVIYLMKKDESAYIRHHSVEALNFQISVFIYMIVSLVLCFVIIGIPLLVALIIIDIIYTIIAAIKASEGKEYRYPMSIRFVN